MGLSSSAEAEDLGKDGAGGGYRAPGSRPQAAVVLNEAASAHVADTAFH